MSQPEPDPSACSSDRKAPGGGAKKMSCNGCRVLRKGCSDNCVLRQCLQWIDSPQSQAAATVFVAKFFGRAGLMAFIEAVSEAERPALFKSLLYESCGRTVSPVHGAVGLMCTGKWHICQAAVQTVLSGGVPECMTVDEDADQWQRLRQIYDLRRVRQKTEQQLVPPNGAHHEADEEVRIRHQEKLQTQTSVKLDLSLKCDSQSNLHHERASSPASASANSDNSVNKEAAAAAADSQPCTVPEDVEAVTVLAYCQSSELNHRSQVPKQKRL